MFRDEHPVFIEKKQFKINAFRKQNSTKPLLHESCRTYPDSDQTTNQIDMSISVQNITKSFDTLNVLQNISFELSQGEIVGLLGLSGSDKSTLMKILATYIKADLGEARINGYDVRTEKQNVQKSIGCLPVHENLNVNISIKDYLTIRFDLEKNE